MQKIKRESIISYLPNKILVEKEINHARVFYLKTNPEKLSGYVIYFIERELRVKDNFALNFAIQKAKELNLPLKIIYHRQIFSYKPKQIFLDIQIEEIKKIFLESNFDYEQTDQTFEEYIYNLNIHTLIIDFNPILKREYLKNLTCNIIEIDGHNIIPARYVSDKQEYSAATLRRKIYNNIAPFLKEFVNISAKKTQADYVLEDFIQNKLQYYKEFKNNPCKNVLSGLSKYINWGFISSQRVALEVLKSDCSIENKEAFWEELIIRKELADNFCLYCKRFKQYDCVPHWAVQSLDFHKNDLRFYIYTKEELELANTHDILWNAAQIQLLRDGVIHGYLRMYWAKKLLEWSKSSEEALKTAIYFNDKYAYDAPSPNGYVGILWALGGLHDRAFRDYPITGKIRRMTFNSLKKKFDINYYINQYVK